MLKLNTVDFETEKIQQRPHYPPKPAGVAIRWQGGAKEYLSFGHPSGNNCTLYEARCAVEKAFEGEVLFHHAMFDIDVADCHLGVRPPRRYHDSMFTMFLDNPHEPDLGLKPLSEKHLNLPPDERDDLKDWILKHVKGAQRAKKKWGEHIAAAPGDVVAPYAISDVDRTYRLQKKFLPRIEKRGMLEAYQREVALVPITLEMERSGVRVDHKRLKLFRAHLEDMNLQMTRTIAKRLRLDPKKLKSDSNPEGFNLNSGAQLADALYKADKLSMIVKTAGGKISTSMGALEKSCSDKKLLKLLALRSVAKKYLDAFINPWLEQADATHGRVLPSFHQVRGRSEDGGYGARSGRYSSSDPNMQTVGKNVDDSKNKEILGFLQTMLRDDYKFEFLGLRDFILPDDGCVMICVDYSQQELRFLAHFERGLLMKAYNKNPDLDMHDYIGKLITDATGKTYPRVAIKTVVFGIIYGMGIDKLGIELEITKDEAKELRAAIFKVVPGIEQLMTDLKGLAAREKPLITWGGREYYCEEPKYVEKFKRWMSFEYKMLNYQIQPSGADCTKQGMLNVHRELPQCRIALQVHDELVVMARSRKYGPRIAYEMCNLRGLRVPMKAEIKYSEKSWARAEK